MSRRLGPRASAAAAIGALALSACSNVLGLKDLEPYSPDAGDGSASGDSPADGPTSHDATIEDSPSDAAGDSPLDGPATGDAPPDGNCGAAEIDCNGTCTNETSDGANCGACGHSCQGGTCSGGQCLPVSLASIDAFDLVVVGTTVYWVDGASTAGNLWACDVDSCSPTAIKPMQVQPLRIAFDGAHTIFWTEHGTGTGSDGAVWSYDVSSKQVTTIASGQASPEGIAADASYVVWVSDYGSANAVFQYARSSHSLSSTSLPSTSPSSVALGAGEIYFTETGSNAIGQCAEGSCSSPTAFASGQNLAFAAWVDATWVYWTDFGNGGAVWRAPIATASPTQLPGGAQANPERVVSDGSDVYWTNNGTTSSDGALVGCAQPACATSTVLQSGLARPVGLAIDAHAVYYGTTGDHRLHKLAR